jgi:molybdopterin-guanine dinucleotide biosynthesis adapter protein
MKLYGVTGWKNAGKTSLMERLIAHFTADGLRVSAIKHVHHDVDLDRPGKDSHRHRSAGAAEVILAGQHRFALLSENRAGEVPLAALLARLSPVDLVLIEGYKRDSHPKIEVWRAAMGHALIHPHDPTIRALASDTPRPDLPLPVLDLNDTAQIAAFIARDLGLGHV